jgi:BlaI family transcriptional regulator, penicillinase repressor
VKDLHELTDIQLAIMDVVWERGAATVTDVHETLFDSTAQAKKTIGTMMARLEKQGFLTHRESGREFVYEPGVTKDEVGTAKVRNVLQRLFGGSLPALVSHALRSEEVAPGDAERVASLVAEWKKSRRTAKKESGK